MRTSILYEDKDIIVIHKPAGLATETSKVGQADVVSELKNHIKSPYLGVVHRLDQPVEGLLVFGRTKAAAAALTRQLSEGILNKRYYAVIGGQMIAAEGELVDYLYKNKENRAELVPKDQAAAAGAKEARLRYRVLESPGEIALAEITIQTGRFHQIRAQMSHAGMPLLGDVKYGTESSIEQSARLQVRNVALCAYEIQVEHPTKRKRMCFQTEPRERIFQFFQKFTSETTEKNDCFC